MSNESYSQLVVVADSDGVTSSFELQPQSRGTLVNVKLDERSEVDAVAHTFVVLAYTLSTSAPARRAMERVMVLLEKVIRDKEMPF